MIGTPAADSRNWMPSIALSTEPLGPSPAGRRQGMSLVPGSSITWASSALVNLAKTHGHAHSFWPFTASLEVVGRAVGAGFAVCGWGLDSDPSTGGVVPQETSVAVDGEPGV